MSANVTVRGSDDVTASGPAAAVEASEAAAGGAPGPVGRDRTVAVVGTGTMGQGIAQVALVAGHPVRLYDSAPGRAEEAVAALTARLDRLVEKGRGGGPPARGARGRAGAPPRGPRGAGAGFIGGRGGAQEARVYI
ncbi:3-hydroxyacyl-CoA dehydrogenase NAD-binding domain-containing protein, partial [Streptomyces sp. NPDC059556]|uniref:3-hydroxyacyl-CoA dehydrogenase NAD-binding domain-containing protein n=1 Tax=Streptomyces sp. NPDC059556 TaxID=3346863 RepID=UPI003695E717